MKVNFENVGGWEEGGEWTKWLTVGITTEPQHFLWLINLQPSQQKVQRSMGGFAWKQATSKSLVSLFSAPVGHRPLEFTLDLLVQLVHLVQLVQLKLLLGLLDHLLRPVQHDLLLLHVPAAPATAHSWTLSGQTTFFHPFTESDKQSTIIFHTITEIITYLPGLRWTSHHPQGVTSQSVQQISHKIRTLLNLTWDIFAKLSDLFFANKQKFLHCKFNTQTNIFPKQKII